MRLLQLCTHFEGGGISRHVIDLSNALRAQGHYVAIAGTRGKWMSEEIDADFFFIDLHNVAEAGGPIPRRLLAALRGGLALRRALKAQRIEMIHAHESAPALVARIAATRAVSESGFRATPSPITCSRSGGTLPISRRSRALL